MNIIAVDDEKLVLDLSEREIRKAAPDCSLKGFTSAAEALAYARGNAVDAAFLDISMGGMNGLELAAALKESNTKTAVIFITGYNQYINDAFKLHCSGYVMKPVRAESVSIELARLRYNPPDKQKLPEVVGDFAFDHALQRLYKDGKDQTLTPMEYKILLSLTVNAGCFMPAQELFEKAFGMSATEDMRTLYVHISGIRKKLELYGNNTSIDIEHKRGKGYRLLIK